MISRFFIDRPIFAAVLSIVIALAGGLALLSLPIAQYPEITPPQVQVSISYPGASAQVVADTVAAPVEQQVNGVENMLYMSSQSGNDGSYTLSVTFEVGVNLNTALVMVQNRVMLAMPQLPTEVQLQGITIRKKTPDILLVVNFTSDNDRYDNIYLSNYATINVLDEILRVTGVADVKLFGQRDFAMRAWLDPRKLAARNLSALDVQKAILAQNVEVVAGQIGQPPGGTSRSFEFPINAQGRLKTPEEFGAIVVKAVSASTEPALMPATAATAATTTAPATSGPAPMGGQSGFASTSVNPVLVGQSASNSSGMSSASGTSGATASGTSTMPTSGPSNPLVGMGSPIVLVGGAGSSGGGTTASGPTSTTTMGVGPATLGATSSGSMTANTSTAPGAMTGAAGPPSATAGPVTGGASGGTASSGVITPAGGMVGGDALQGGDLQNQPWPSHALVRLRDLGRVELGASMYSNGSSFDGKPSVGMAVFLLPGSNAFDVATRVKRHMAELETRFPEGVNYHIAYDTTPFIRESIQDVVRALFEAVALVAVVVLLFLQNWRAAVIPLIAVPVAIVGTFAVMAVLGFTLNNISLFGLVLAIGIVVDDAIVVVENVERWLERGEPPREAAYKAMEEVTGPVVAIGVVLSAVFVPCAFVGGITGQFFRQFAVTIAASTILSTLNSLTLSPALAAILMRKRDDRPDLLTRLLQRILGWLFRLFEWGFTSGTRLYTRVVGWLIRVSLAMVLFYLGLLVLTVWVFKEAPTGFVPDQDQGRLIVNVQLPDSASMQRTLAVMAQADAIFLRTPGIDHTTSAAGLSLMMSANSSNFASMFVILKPFAERQTPELSANGIMARLRKEFAAIKEADLKVFGAPPVPGLSVASGFKFMIQDRGGMGLGPLQGTTDRLVGALRKDPAVAGVLTQFRSKTPQLYMDLDRTKAQALGVPINDVNQTMQMNLGSKYVNSFNAFGRHWQVDVQAEGQYRNRVEDVNQLEVRNQWGEMIPLGTLVRMRDINGPISITRYNLYVSAAISGNVAPGVSSGTTIADVDAAAERVLPRSMGTEWTELMFLQIRAGNTAIYVFFLAVVFVFLALAALYESWALPLAVILVVPLCLLCSIGGVLLAHKEVDIFVQIGLVVLVGLACKNAILIVEFAQYLRRQGKPRYEAALEASRLRLRPILMTSMAFILGVLPLVLASGAGAEMRRSLGIAVFSGMLGVTLFGIFLTPVFFDLIQRGVDSRAFSHGVVRWGGSALLGGLLGGGTGYLLAQLGVGASPRLAIYGAVIGGTAAIVIPAFWRKARTGPGFLDPARPAAPEHDRQSHH